MKTITLTDDQFNTLFNRIDKMVKTIVDASVDYQDTEILNEWEDLFDVHSVLEKAMNRHGFDVSNSELSMRLYDQELEENIEHDMENLL